MVYIPDGWNDSLIVDSYQMSITVDGWKVPMEMVVSSTWISEEDLTRITIPLSEFDFTLNNINGELDKDNPNSLLGRFSINGVVKPVLLAKCDDGAVYEFPLGMFIITQKTYSGNELTLTCFDPTVALQTFEGAEETKTEMQASKFIDQICSDARAIGVPIELDGKVEPDADYSANYWLEVGKTYTKQVLWAGMDTGYNLASYPDTTIPGITLTFEPRGGAFVTLADGTPTQEGIWEFQTNHEGLTIKIGIKPAVPVYTVEVEMNKEYTEPQTVISSRAGCPVLPTGPVYVIGGLTFIRTTQTIEGAITFTGQANLTGTTYFPLYEYVPPNKPVDTPKVVGYVKIVVSEISNHLILVKFNNGKSITFLDSLCVLFKTILSGYALKKTRDGKLLLTYTASFHSQREMRESPSAKVDKVMEFPQPDTDGSNTNIVRITYTDELTEGEIDKEVWIDDDISIKVTDYLDSPIEAQDFDSSIITSNEYWAETIAKKYLKACATLDPYTVELIDSPEVECGDLLFAKGKYGMYPLYVKKVTMEFNGDLRSTIEGARLTTSYWNKYRSWRWDEVKKHSWGGIFSEYPTIW